MRHKISGYGINKVLLLCQKHEAVWHGLQAILSSVVMQCQVLLAGHSQTEQAAFFFTIVEASNIPLHNHNSARGLVKNNC